MSSTPVPVGYARLYRATGLGRAETFVLEQEQDVDAVTTRVTGDFNYACGSQEATSYWTTH
jgi:hypothetical protein